MRFLGREPPFWRIFYSFWAQVLRRLEDSKGTVTFFLFLFIIWAESLMIPFICTKRYKNKNESYVISIQRFVNHLYLSSSVLVSACTAVFSLSIYTAFCFSIHVTRFPSLHVFLLSIHSSISLLTP
jgi:hypothetical protein